ncbi:leucine-rich repeat domain-containing protein [Ruminococcus flavefaciens]|uniref:Transglutaminase-like domain-containing protein n=2 Tax=Ruminococcus flavefaciens TaxID=1265 RepID=W7UH09_RUMFL|nr:leucine-rich repeat domain-containing protein [Ruminococcus flavefaciens]EWM53218.1 hypothetical protein RF007C_09575 [Ruminococcus flavefaciens 007c]
MKHSKFITWLSAALLGISSAAFSSGMTAKAAEKYTCTKDKTLFYYYNTETHEARIDRYKGSETELTIPSNIDGYTVTSIGPSAFSGSAVTKVSIPDTVTIICGSAFKNSSLTSVTIPASVTKVLQDAFSGCTSLTSLTVLGATELQARSFKDCKELSEVQLSDDSRTSRSYKNEAFDNCPNLHTVNGVTALNYKTDSNGIKYPFIDPSIETTIRNHFSRSVNVGFVNDYCTDLCEYILRTETSYDPEHPENDWMNDALKARQLHDWLIRHCEYEDGDDGETPNDNENHVASSVFLSYAVNTRGAGVGETVCDGFAKAYTMLLSKAGIESYYIGHDIHVWNLVKIDGKFYHVDVTDDNFKNWTDQKTRYWSFLKKSLNGGASQINNTDHPLLMVYKNNITNEIENCPEDYPDNNNDGILDYDFDLDGKSFQYDFVDDLNAYQGLLRFAYGSLSSTDQINDRMADVLYNLNKARKGYWDYFNTSAPVSQTVRAGGTAEFRVRLFGDDLTYQWQYYNKNTGAWENAPYNGAKSATLYVPANSTTKDMQFKCFVYNKEKNYIYSYPVTLTLI